MIKFGKHNIGTRYSRRDDIDDLKQEAWIAANTAKKHFNPQKGKLSHLTSTYISRELNAYKIKNQNILSLSTYDRINFLQDYFDSTKKRVKFNEHTKQTDNLHQEEVIFNHEVQELLQKALGMRNYNILVDRFIPMTLKEVAIKYNLHSPEHARLIINQLMKQAKNLIKLHGDIYGWAT